MFKFYDVEITDITLDLKNSNCEDSVNFVRSTGTIKDVKIFNSRFDSIDADFSNLILGILIFQKVITIVWIYLWKLFY